MNLAVVWSQMFKLSWSKHCLLHTLKLVPHFNSVFIYHHLLVLLYDTASWGFHPQYIIMLCGCIGQDKVSSTPGARGLLTLNPRSPKPTPQKPRPRGPGKLRMAWLLCREGPAGRS